MIIVLLCWIVVLFNRMEPIQTLSQEFLRSLLDPNEEPLIVWCAKCQELILRGFKDSSDGAIIIEKKSISTE